MTLLLNLRQTVNFFNTRLVQKFPLIQKSKDVVRLTTAHPHAQATLQRYGIRNLCTNTTDVPGARLAKDIILFKYENPKYYKMMNFFGIAQFCFWTYLSHFAFTQLRDAPPAENKSEDELKWYERINLGDNKYRNGITISCFLVGYGILFTVWMFTLRSVRFLILRPGGKEISIVTYGPFNKNRILTVPLKCVSAQESRQTARVQLPLKVKNRSLYFVLDMRGEFRNPELFDQTAGLKRRF